LPLFRDDPHFFLAAAACEPEAGSDIYLPIPDPKIGIKLSAEISGNEVILNGMKHMIALGNVAKLIMVYARSDRTKPMTEGTTLFLVSSDAPGFRVGRVHDPFGWRLFPTAELFFENCRIPKKNQVLGWNEAYAGVAETVALCTAWAGAMGVGIARAAFEKALQHAQTRVQGTAPIIQHANTAMQLAEMFMKIEAARYLTWKQCWNLQIREYFDLRMVKAPKIFASQVAKDVAISAMEIHGGCGVMKEIGMEKLVRDALTLLHVYGPNDISLLHLGRALEKQMSPARR
jgi:alkylation response protein AidB-like acyl-CoA dehydrogenase